MQYGIELAAAGACADPRILAELAQTAEAAGWDGLFLEDYLIHWQGDLPTSDPWVALAVVALRTQRLRIGTTVTPLPRRRPWKLASETLTIDQLSDGRLILGVGLGGLDDDRNFDRLGEVTDRRVRAELLDEGLTILAGLWSGRPVTFTGRHYTVAGVTFLPHTRSARIPIWVGGSALRPSVVRRAARWDGIVPVPVSGDDGSWRYLVPDEVRTLKRTIARQRPTGVPFDIALGGQPRGDDWDRERAQRTALAEAGVTWWLEWIPPADLDSMRQAIARGPLRIAVP